MASMNDTNEAPTLQDVMRILPQQEQTVQVRLQAGDSRSSRPSSNNALYHTLRYDFKPASINADEPATLELGKDGQVTIKASNVGGSTCTFRGQRRPHVKECLMVIDNRTGEVVLQKLTDNITVKATRSMAGNGASAAAGVVVNGGAGNGAAGGPSAANSNSNYSSGSSSNGAPVSTTISHSTTAAAAANLVSNDGPQLSEESSDSSDESSSSCSSSSSNSSSNSSSSSASSASSNKKGFTF